jgi:hypothetical protein
VLTYDWSAVPPYIPGVPLKTVTRSPARTLSPLAGRIRASGRKRCIMMHRKLPEAWILPGVPIPGGSRNTSAPSGTRPAGQTVTVASMTSRRTSWLWAELAGTALPGWGAGILSLGISAAATRRTPAPSLPPLPAESTDERGVLMALSDRTSRSHGKNHVSIEISSKFPGQEGRTWIARLFPSGARPESSKPCHDHETVRSLAGKSGPHNDCHGRNTCRSAIYIPFWNPRQ